MNIFFTMAHLSRLAGHFAGKHLQVSFWVNEDNTQVFCDWQLYCNDEGSGSIQVSDETLFSQELTRAVIDAVVRLDPDDDGDEEKLRADIDNWLRNR